ncbi:redoxin domain-containing protein [Psychroflexus sp. CAK57W]|uniref:peroxiredoxin family protein n=1 Tax=Psychroflexus curvus TaxID=2873595 RepID=UPI001CCE239E|nr:redoxin domain-containing protein [Psychroflexus curvus]MBZ9627132.1 redoxin domain-containing protein [Psychroflexus curvus]MBZ9787138.1 redoxin domain-containing protein [Psychroflexus curvus]
MKYIILIFSLFIAQEQMAQSDIETLPEFTIYTLEGESFTQDNIKKDSPSYFIYYDPSCGHCVRAFKRLNLKSEQLKKADVQIYTVSAGTKQQTLRFFEEIAPRLKTLENLHILKDRDYALADIFFVRLFPSGYLYDKENKLIKSYEGEAEAVLFLNDLPE